jgi:hypothetical protein
MKRNLNTTVDDSTHWEYETRANIYDINYIRSHIDVSIFVFEQHAYATGNLEYCLLLYQQDKDYSGRFYVAACHGQTAALQFLIDRGYKGNFGNTFSCTCEFGHVDTVAYLMNKENVDPLLGFITVYYCHGNTRDESKKKRYKDIYDLLEPLVCKQYKQGQYQTGLQVLADAMHDQYYLEHMLYEVFNGDNECKHILLDNMDTLLSIDSDVLITAYGSGERAFLECIINHKIDLGRIIEYCCV